MNANKIDIGRPLFCLGKDRRFLALCPRCDTTVEVRSKHKVFKQLYVESQQGSELKKRGPTPGKITVGITAS